jgi:hypothetical protein
VKALEVIAAAPPPPTTLLPAAEAKQNQPAPRVLPVAPDATVRTAVPKAFVRQTFQASGSLLEAKNADGTRPPIFPHYLQSHRR